MSRDPDTPRAAAGNDDVTRAFNGPEPGSSRSAPSSGSLDGARFVPGTVLGDRYRIVGLLGRGGMGEVYRAEDLKLGEPVALKFLPMALSLDGAALARFHREVRVARQIAHRNVCRVFDIGEAEGLHFLSMEYIDGEDLSSLLRRIGRAPGDKAVELARQICAGLSAAHEAGVLHRDVKPANVMIDGKGRAKITDFGLARVADELKSQEMFVGTAGYMAPEQISSGEVSVRTDLYALGLVLYELFTGERAFPGRTWAELLSGDRFRKLKPPSSHVQGLDPVVERVILRCLKEEPSRRPASALEVSAALPGDALAAALAAGETPSPEMVAAAREKGTLKPRAALACFAGLVALLLAWVPLAERTQLVGLARLPKSPEVLADRAATLAAELGAGPGSHDYRHGSWWVRRAYLRHLRRSETPLDSRALNGERPAALTFWYRLSPSPLHPWAFLIWTPSPDDPPPYEPGMARVELDPAGRLLGWLAVPRAEETFTPATSGEVPWDRFFAAAGLAREAFEVSESRFMLPLPADKRLAWEGTWPERPDLPIRVEAAAFRGRPVYFEIAEPWDGSRGRLAPSPGTFDNRLFQFILPIWVLALLAAAWQARRHLSSGRGDLRGATRLTLFVFSCQLLGWLIGAHHSSSADEFWAFQAGLGEALLWSAHCGVMYLAVEPFLRRRWPEGLISWSRLLAGKFRDPLVGRDVLIGGRLGAGLVVANALVVVILQALGRPASFTDNVWPSHLLGIRLSAAGLLSTHVFVPLFQALALVFVFQVLHVLSRRKWLAAVVVALLMPAVLAPWGLVELPYSLAIVGLAILPIARFGLLPTLAFWVYYLLLRLVPMTTDPGLWYAGRTLFAVGLAAALGFWGFRTASAGRPFFDRTPRG